MGHPALPRAVVAVCAEVHKQWSGPRIHLFFHTNALLTGLPSHTHQSPQAVAPKRGITPLTCPGVHCAVGLKSVVTSAQGVMTPSCVEGAVRGDADTSGAWQGLRHP